MAIAKLQAMADQIDALQSYDRRLISYDIRQIAAQLKRAIPAPSVAPPPAEPAHLTWARGELGVKEKAGKDDNPRIVWYHSHTASGEAPDEVPWCSSFVCAALEENGIRSTRSKAAKSWLTWGEETKVFEPGCIVVLRRGVDRYHVAIGVQYSATTGTIQVLGGNQVPDSVTLRWRSATDVVSMRRIPMGPSV